MKVTFWSFCFQDRSTEYFAVLVLYRNSELKKTNKKTDTVAGSKYKVYCRRLGQKPTNHSREQSGRQATSDSGYDICSDYGRASYCSWGLTSTATSYG